MNLSCCVWLSSIFSGSSQAERHFEAIQPVVCIRLYALSKSDLHMSILIWMVISDLVDEYQESLEGKAVHRFRYF